MTNIQGFEVDDAYYREQIARNLSPVVCYGCGNYLSFVRDIHKNTFCPDCAPKASLLKKYSRPGYNPTAQERAQIFKTNITRVGRS